MHACRGQRGVDPDLVPAGDGALRLACTASDGEYTLQHRSVRAVQSLY
jgi:hypothetical protein